MTPQPGTAGTGDDPLDQLVTQELTVNGQTVTRLVGLAFDSAEQTDGVLRFDGTGSTNGITDGSAKVLVNGTVYDIAGAEWVDLSGTKHTVDSWEKVISSQFNVSITGTNGPVAPGNTLDVTADVSNSGTDQDTQTVTLDINNGVGQVDSTSVTVAGGGSTTQTLSWAVPSGQAEQDYTATVSSADDSASQTVTVRSAVPASLVSHWTFDTDDTNSGTAVDTVGSNDGTIEGGTTTGVSGANQTYTTSEAYSFDGTDDYVDVPHTTAFDVGQYSIAGWFKTSSTASQAIFAKYQGFDGYHLDASFNGSCALYNGGDNGKNDWIKTDSSFADGNWHHVVGTRSGSGASGLDIYVDGAAVSTSVGNNEGSNTSTHNFDINIGWRESNSYEMVGDIDDVRFYDKTLTSTEVSNLYNNGSI